MDPRARHLGADPDWAACWPCASGVLLDLPVPRFPPLRTARALRSGREGQRSQSAEASGQCLVAALTARPG